MSPKVKTALNLVLIIAVCYASYVSINALGSYGSIALVILMATFFFNVLKKRKLAFLFFGIGFSVGLYVLLQAFMFSLFTEEQRDKFNIDTAVIFEQTDFNTSLQKAKMENKPVFIDFYAAWCAPCLKFTKTVLTDEFVGEQMNKTFINLKYDVEKGEGPMLAKRYKVSYYPTLLIIDADGNLIENISEKSIPKKEHLLSVSEKYKEGLPWK